MQTRKKLKLGCTLFCLPYITDGYAQQNSFLESIEQLEVPQPYGQAASNRPATLNAIAKPAVPKTQPRPVLDNRSPTAGSPVVSRPAVAPGLLSGKEEPPPAIFSAKPGSPPRQSTVTLPEPASVERADIQKAVEQARQADSETIRVLNVRIAELQATASTNQTAATAASEQTIQSLKARIVSLQSELGNMQKQSGLDAESLQIIPSLKAQVASLQNQLTNAQRQASLDAASLETIPSLKSQVASLQGQLMSLQKQSGQDAASLKAQVSSLQEQLARAQKPSGPDTASLQIIQSLKAQVTALQNKVAAQPPGKGIAAVPSALAMQELKDKVLELELKSQRLEEERNAAQAAAGRHDFELGIATDEARREKAELDERNSRLQQTLSMLDFISYPINTAKSSDANAYALGVHYFQKMQSEIVSLAGRGSIIASKPAMKGFIDAYQNKTLMNDMAVDQLAGSLLQPRVAARPAANSRMIVYLQGKVYETLPNGTYLVVEKKGDRNYDVSDTVAYTTRERDLAANRIINSGGSRVKYSSLRYPLLKTAVARGGIGGRVTLYGLAQVVYPAGEIPAGVSPDVPVSITYTLK